MSLTRSLLALSSIYLLIKSRRATCSSFFCFVFLSCFPFLLLSSVLYLSFYSAHALPLLTCNNSNFPSLSLHSSSFGFFSMIQVVALSNLHSNLHFIFTFLLYFSFFCFFCSFTVVSIHSFLVVFLN